MDEKKTVATDQAPKAIGPYSQAVWAGDLLFLSGQIPLNPASGPTRFRYGRATDPPSPWKTPPLSLTPRGSPSPGWSRPPCSSRI